MRRSYWVIDVQLVTYDEAWFNRQIHFKAHLSPLLRAAADRLDRELVGRTFVFEKLACGHLGQCLGEQGGNLKQRASRRICEGHDEGDD